MTRVRNFEAWRAGQLTRPISATFVLDFARLIMDVYPDDSPTILVEGKVIHPEAVIMRGRLSRYELVVDSGKVAPGLRESAHTFVSLQRLGSALFS